VVRFVALWRVTSDRRPTGSSSCSNAPGLVGIGNHDHVASLAESLIHEASHHYFYTVLRLGAVDDQSDTRLHLNPFFGRNRPLDRILFAYHAFLNVHRFCLVALEASTSDLSYFEPREKEVREGLRTMEAAIDGNPALTPLGNAIWADLQIQTPVSA
jgi:HEXXH motif-containing protein